MNEIAKAWILQIVIDLKTAQKIKPSKIIKLSEFPKERQIINQTYCKYNIFLFLYMYQ